MHGSAQREARFIIVGAGMSGILAAIRLREAGYRNIAIYEKKDRVGGTWRENSYPGLTCDVSSHTYTYSFEFNPDWSSEYPSGPEILAYFQRTADKYGVTPLVRFNSEIVDYRFEDGRWHVTTADGRTDAGDYVIAATGVLHHPAWPDIPGRDSFAAASFHSAEWDHSVALDGRRVGIIGNGSTGVQIVSALAGRVARLVQFQRTPQWVRKGQNEPYSEAEREAFRRDPALIEALRNDPVAQQNVQIWSQAITDAASPMMTMIEDAVRQTFEAEISDPVLREKLRPDHRVGCKRMIISPDYYEKVQQPGVVIVRDPIERIEPAGVRTADGVLHELDVLVFATGFHADRFLRPARVTGDKGADLEQLWAERPVAYFGTIMPGFPNLFMLNGPTAPVGNFSLIDVAERQMDYVLALIDAAAARGTSRVAVSEEATRQYEAERREAARGTIFASGCRSWYLDREGVPAIWPWTYDRFIDAMAAPRLADYDFARETAS